MDVAVIKYNAGNIGSVVNALERIGVRGMVTDDHDLIRQAPRVIFPGVGEAGSTMEHLRESGLDRLIVSLKQPVLGICLGMQLMCSFSEEGSTQGLGIFDERVLKFRGTEKVPHMGWNAVQFEPEGLFSGVEVGSYLYFVHSYYVPKGQHTLAICDYGESFAAAMHRDNFWAVQFHPEKSGNIGGQLLKNFMLL